MSQSDVDGPLDESEPEAFSAAFQPHPAARSLRWKQLVPPTREAVAAVLRHMDAAALAARDPARKGEKTRDPGSASRSSEVSTSLLVTGQRGSGKTTVLLSSRFAIENWPSFFEGAGQGDERAGGVRVRRLRDIARDREDQVVWLDILDLEPLPSKANLLATLLVRVRTALDRISERSSQPASLYERSSDDCWSQIDQLVKDATLMWDNVFASDSRQSANEQIRVAEIYADFRKRFVETMEQVCTLLSSCRFGRGGENRILLVLPIDNVDRSSAHLHAIMKLTQMVACRQLWLILAAGHADFQVLLERAFQRELVAGHSASRPSRHGEDEVFATARRQAAATRRQLLPPTQRIGIRALKAEETLAFDPDPARPRPQPLRDLLAEIAVRLDRREDRPWLPGTLFDLLHLDEREGEPRKPSEAGLHALALPARNAVDLWQILAAERGLAEASEKDERAIRIVARMLHDAVEESELPSWAVKILNECAVKHDPHFDDRISMDFARRSFYAWKRYLPTFRDALPKAAGTSAEVAVLEIAIHINDFYGFKIELTEERNELSVDLPPEVEGWYMLLYDLLYLVPEGRLIGEKPKAKQQNLAVAWTTFTLDFEGVLVELRIPWLTPLWPTYFERLVFLSRWRSLAGRDREQAAAAANGRPLGEILTEEHLWHFAWIDTVCSLASGYEPYFRTKPNAVDRETVRREIAGRVAALYERLRGPDNRRHGDREIETWLEVELWLLLRTVPPWSADSWLRGIEPAGAGELAGSWERNRRYLETRWQQLVGAQLRESDWHREWLPDPRPENAKLLKEAAGKLSGAIVALAGDGAQAPAGS